MWYRSVHQVCRSVLLIPSLPFFCTKIPMFSYITFSDAELLAAFTALIACSPTPPIILILVHLLRTLILSISRRRLPLLCTLLVQQILNGRCNLRVYPSVVQY